MFLRLSATGALRFHPFGVTMRYVPGRRPTQSSQESPSQETETRTQRRDFPVPFFFFFLFLWKNSFVNVDMPYTGEICLSGEILKSRHNWVQKQENAVRRGIKKKTNAFADRASKRREKKGEGGRQSTREQRQRKRRRCDSPS